MIKDGWDGCGKTNGEKMLEAAIMEVRVRRFYRFLKILLCFLALAALCKYLFF